MTAGPDSKVAVVFANTQIWDRSFLLFVNDSNVKT